LIDQPENFEAQYLQEEMLPCLANILAFNKDASYLAVSIEDHYVGQLTNIVVFD